MRRGVCLLLLGVASAAVGVGSARADGVTTTTAPTTTTTTTTTTTSAQSYAPLAASALPSGCVGAGTAALVLPGRPVIAVGSPASGFGPSAYSTVLSFDSSAASGSTCTSSGVVLSSVSLFGGVVTASSVQARNGEGTVSGLEVDGAAVSAGAGETVPVEGWGLLMLGATAGRVTSPFALRLLQAHGSLPAGTVVAVAFAASAQPVAKPKLKQHQQAQHGHAKGASHARRASHSRGASQAGGRSGGTRKSKTHQSRQAHGSKPAARLRPQDDYWSHYTFPAADGFPSAAQNNDVVSLAMKYLGVPYLWGGASPKTGFDCSGLVTYVFAKLGVSLPHYAAAQWYSPDGVWVKPSRLQPGDLVFFTGSDGTRKEPGHVGIYLGDGDLIDAPHTGAFVRVDSFSERWFAHQYVGARRILPASLAAAADHAHAQPTGPRHLQHVTTQAASAAAILSGFPPLVTAGQMGDSPGITAASIAAEATAAPTVAPREWMGIGFAGVLLLLLPTGAVGYRRRRRRAPEAPPSTDPA